MSVEAVHEILMPPAERAVAVTLVGVVGGVLSGPIVKVTPLLAAVPKVTTTFPVVAVVGTKTPMLVGLQLPAVPADTPLNVTVLVPCITPKFAPAIVTALPTGPEGGLRLVILGPGPVTVKPMALLAAPLTVTTTLPVVAPTGTGTTMVVEFQLVGVAGVPLKVTAPMACAAKFVPVIVTSVPVVPDVGLRFVILGVGVVTVKFTLLLAAPPTVTTTGPVVAPAGTSAVMNTELQLVGAMDPADVPLNVTVLVPCAEPKFAPEIFTSVRTPPEVGFRLVMIGGGGITVKFAPLLATLPTVTTTLPVVAPGGASTLMLVAFQALAAAASVPLKLTVLELCELPKLVPVIVTGVPTAPDVGPRLVMLGGPPPAPPAALNAATAAPQLALAESVALAATLPAEACT